MIEIKKYLEGKKIIKGNLMSRVFSMCKKVTAMSCVIGLVMIMNTPLVFAYEAHTVNVTARIVNNIPGINPPGGEFCSSGEFEVRLSVSLADADVYYTTDGTNPIRGINKYSAPFELSDNVVTTVKAVACHNIMRNGGQVLIQSAIMEKVFDVSAPSVNVITNDYAYFDTNKNAIAWYCGGEYRVDWEIGNYRQGSTADIIYIVDKNDDGVIGVGDDIHPIAENLPTENTGNYSLKVDHCYTGFAWVKIIITEPNGCGGLGISEIIYEPMPPVNNSCGVSAPDIISAVSESEPVVDPIIDNDDSSDISDNADNTSDDNSNDSSDLNSEDIDVDNVPEENIEEDDASEDIRNENSEEDADNNTDADDPDLLNEDEENGEEDLDDDEDGGDETDENVEDENADDLDNAEENVGADENIVLENDGIVIDREENFDEEENSNESDDDEDDSIIANSDVSLDGDDLDDESIDDDSDSDDNDSDNDDDDSFDNDAPIEGDDDSTEIGFSL